MRCQPARAEQQLLLDCNRFDADMDRRQMGSNWMNVERKVAKLVPREPESGSLRGGLNSLWMKRGRWESLMPLKWPTMAYTASVADCCLWKILARCPGRSIERRTPRYPKSRRNQVQMLLRIKKMKLIVSYTASAKSLFLNIHSICENASISYRVQRMIFDIGKI